MRRALWGIAAVIIIGIVVVLVAPLFISAENVRNALFDQVESATDYRIRVGGKLDISAFPSLDLVAGDVQVSKRIGEQYQDVATAKQLRFGNDYRVRPSTHLRNELGQVLGSAALAA